MTLRIIPMMRMTMKIVTRIEKMMEKRSWRYVFTMFESEAACKFSCTSRPMLLTYCSCRTEADPRFPCCQKLNIMKFSRCRINAGTKYHAQYRRQSGW